MTIFLILFAANISMASDIDIGGGRVFSQKQIADSIQKIEDEFSENKKIIF